nr:DUF3050 domain-containing protein [Xanthovirga aplysinae]
MINHPVYQNIQTVEDLIIFMETHVFAVWDFMSLLKALQIELTCTKVPWIPTQNPKIRRMINEIVMEEESDVDQEGKVASHLELYLDAMHAAGGEINQISRFIDDLRKGHPLSDIIKSLPFPFLQHFLEFTFQTIESKKLHLIASVFTFGREDLIPDMFTALVKDLDQKMETDLSKFIYYLERHIELDSGEHGPMALQMIEELCGDDEHKWEEATKISMEALKKRVELWDGINKGILERRADAIASL